jgi:hypothetical protein
MSKNIGFKVPALKIYSIVVKSGMSSAGNCCSVIWDA